MTVEEERARWVARMNEGMWTFVPHNRELGLEVVDYRPGGQLWMKLPYAERLVGNPDTGVLHGGAITTLMDAACGMAVMVALGHGAAIATIDLRIDYLRAGAPGQAVICRASCYKLTRNVAFTRAVAYHDDETDPIATSMGTFMIGTKPGGPRPSKESP